MNRHEFPRSRLKTRLKKIFAPNTVKKPYNVHAALPNAYAKRFWLSKDHTLLVELYAKALKMPKVKVVNELINMGFKSLFIQIIEDDSRVAAMTPEQYRRHKALKRLITQYLESKGVDLKRARELKIF